MGYYSYFNVEITNVGGGRRRELLEEDLKGINHRLSIETIPQVIDALEGVKRGIESTLRGEVDLEAVIDEIENVSGYRFSLGGMGICSEDTWKFYDYEDDFAEVSKKFPNLLFSVRVDGEEQGDISMLYAKNGKTEKVNAEIAFREPSQELLDN